jgi:hypothetical protein
VVAPNTPTENSEEPTAWIMVMPVAAISPGTIRKPPPMPKKPETAPTPRPMAMMRGALPALKRTSPSPSLRRGISMAIPTAIITSANSGKRICASVRLPSAAPAIAPAAPAAANTVAHGHLTLPRRAWATTLAKALTDTASALVPMATCGLATPTT